VLLNVLCTCAMPRLTLRRAFFFLDFAMSFQQLAVSGRRSSDRGCLNEGAVTRSRQPLFG
jgi:hypothetical protein